MNTRVSPALVGVTTVKALERAFELLEAVSADEGLGLRDLADRAGLPVTTTHRLLQSLADLGYLRLNGSQRWGLGPHAAWLGQQATHQLTHWARPFLHTLVEETGESAGLARLDACHVVHTAVVPSHHAMRTDHVPGDRSLPHCTATGKVLLAQLPHAEVRAILRRTGLPQFTARTITDTAALLHQLIEIRHRGYAVEDDEQEVGVRTIAAPVQGTSTPVALSISGPAIRLEQHIHGPTALIDTVRRVASQIATHYATTTRSNSGSADN